MKIKKMGWVVVLFISLASVLAQTAPQPEREADHVALRSLRDKVALAVSNQDIQGLTSSFAKDFVFTTVDQTPITSQEQLKAFYDRMFHSPKALVTAVKTEPKADILTRFIDANTGVCYGSSQETYTMKDGSIVSMNLRWTATVVKENGEWKVAAAHVGTNFLDNPVLSRLASYEKKIAIACGVGGLLVGLLLGVGISKCKKKCCA